MGGPIVPSVGREPVRAASRPLARAKALVSLMGEAGARWAEDSCYRLGGSLAYCALFSIFPLMLLCVTAFGFVLGDGDGVRQKVLATVTGGSSAEVRALLDQTLQSMQTQRTARGVGAIVGLVTLVIGASGVFSELEASLNGIWRVPSRPSTGIWAAVLSSAKAKAASLAIVLMAAAALFASLLVGTILAAVGQAATHVTGGTSLVSVLELGFSAAALTLLLAWLYRTVPQTRVAWSDVFGGALIASLSFTALKGLLAWYLAHLASYSAYGAVGAVLGLLTWIYVASLILFYGAEFSYVYALRFGSRASPAPQQGEPPAHPAASQLDGRATAAGYPHCQDRR